MGIDEVLGVGNTTTRSMTVGFITSTGASFSGDATFNNNVNFNGDPTGTAQTSIQFHKGDGTSSDLDTLRLYDRATLHIGVGNTGNMQLRGDFNNSSYIFASGNNLFIDGSDNDNTTIKIRTRDVRDGIVINPDTVGSGSVELYHSSGGTSTKKFETTGIGISVFNGASTSATISGPDEIIIDPAVIGNNTGSVRIKGDLFVDGSQTQINSTTIELADFIVGIATTATTDTLADGAGIEFGPSDNSFKYYYNSGNSPSLKSSENLNVSSGKGYQVDQTEVLNATTLGSSVVNSSLTSVGMLTDLSVNSSNSIVGKLGVVL